MQSADKLRSHDPADGPGALGLWNDVQLAISNTAAISSLLSQVHPDAEIQGQAEESDQRAQRLATELGLDPDLYAVLGRGRRDRPRPTLRRGCSGSPFATSSGPASTATRRPGHDSPSSPTGRP